MRALPPIGVRLVRVAALLVAFVLLSTFAPVRLFHPPGFTHEATIAFEPVALDRDAPSHVQLGALRYLRGWSLSSANPGFGGISSMHVENGEVAALSDTGVVARFALPTGKGPVSGRLDRLGDGPGPPAFKRNRDSESMTVAGGHAWVGFERHNAVWRYDMRDWSAQSHAEPRPMAHWPNNTGPESIVRLANGRFLVIAENAPRGPGTTAAVLFEGDPSRRGTASVELGYRPPTGYRPTDAAVLPDGRLLVLNRRVTVWEGFSAKLVLATLPKPEQGALIQGEVIATLRSPLTVDNMEALSVEQKQGRTILWIASDDNFFPLQRTLLLAFELGR